MTMPESSPELNVNASYVNVPIGDSIVQVFGANGPLISKASQSASMVVGHALVVDGGYTLH